MPTRPMIINIIIINLPGTVRCGVSPIDIPTEPKAETTSVTIYSLPIPSGNVSVMDNANVPATTRKAAIVKMKNARFTVSSERVRLKTVGFRPWKKRTMVITMTANVDTLIPPPVEPEDAPIKIKKFVRIKLLKDKCVKSIFVKPDERTVTDNIR